MCCGHPVPAALLTPPSTRYLSGNYFKDRKILDLFSGTDFCILFALRKKKLVVAEKAALAQEGDVTPPALYCSEQAGGSQKYTWVKEALNVALSIMQINTCIPSAPSHESLCCILDAFLEKVE